LGVDSPLHERKQSDDHGDRTRNEEDLIPAALMGQDRVERNSGDCDDVHDDLSSTVVSR